MECHPLAKKEWVKSGKSKPHQCVRGLAKPGQTWTKMDKNDPSFWLSIPRVGSSNLSERASSTLATSSYWKPRTRPCTYGAIGPQPVKIVRSNRNARPGQSGDDGSMSICSKRCSSGLMQNPEAMRGRRGTVEH